MIFRTLIHVLWLSLALAPGAAAQEPPRRVISANLCADQLLLELADASQIVSLSPFARDPGLSWFAERALRFPANRGTGEDIVRLDADLVLTGPWDSRYTRALLNARGMRFIALDAWRSFDEGAAQIRSLARMLGHPERGEALIARIGAGLEGIDRLGAGGAGRATSLVLHRRGYVFHAGLTGEIAQRAGLRDLAPQMGISGAGFVTLEALIAARPDYLIVSDADTRAMDQGQALLAHPALSGIWPPSRRLVLPDRLTICGGPSTPALIERLLSEIQTKVQ